MSKFASTVAQLKFSGPKTSVIKFVAEIKNIIWMVIWEHEFDSSWKNVLIYF